MLLGICYSICCVLSIIKLGCFSFRTMSAPQYKASTFQVITSDYLVEIAVIFIMVLPLIYFFALIDPRSRQPVDETFFFKFALGVILLGSLRALWKLQKVKRIFMQGVEVLGKIVEISSHKSTLITVRYTYCGKGYEIVERIALRRRTNPLTVGGQVIVVVELTRPRQALIRNLYISEEDFEKDRVEFEQLGRSIISVQPLVE